MADVKLAYSSATTLTITSLNSLATSATAAWQSDAIDNSSNKYLDILVHAEFAAVNTAAANSKAWFLWVAGLVDTAGSAYTASGSDVPSGSQGTITIPDFTANAIPLRPLGRIPYSTTNKVLNGGPFSVAQAFGGIIPPKIALVIANHTGYTSAASGNAVKWLGVYETVV